MATKLFGSTATPSNIHSFLEKPLSTLQKIMGWSFSAKPVDKTTDVAGSVDDDESLRVSSLSIPEQSNGPSSSTETDHITQYIQAMIDNEPDYQSNVGVIGRGRPSLDRLTKPSAPLYPDINSVWSFSSAFSPFSLPPNPIVVNEGSRLDTADDEMFVPDPNYVPGVVGTKSWTTSSEGYPNSYGAPLPPSTVSTLSPSSVPVDDNWMPSSTDEIFVPDGQRFIPGAVGMKIPAKSFEDNSVSSSPALSVLELDGINCLLDFQQDDQIHGDTLLEDGHFTHDMWTPPSDGHFTPNTSTPPSSPALSMTSSSSASSGLRTPTDEVFSRGDAHRVPGPIGSKISNESLEHDSEIFFPNQSRIISHHIESNLDGEVTQRYTVRKKPASETSTASCTSYPRTSAALIYMGEDPLPVESQTMEPLSFD